MQKAISLKQGVEGFYLDRLNTYLARKWKVVSITSGQADVCTSTSAMWAFASAIAIIEKPNEELTDEDHN